MVGSSDEIDNTNKLLDKLEKDDTSDISKSTLSDELNKHVLEDDELKHLEELESKMSDLELEDRLKQALKLKEDGNQEYGKGNYEQALDFYKQALFIIPLKYSRERAVLHNNCCAARCRYLNLNEQQLKMDTHPCLHDLNKAIEIHPSYANPFYKRAGIYRKMGEDHLDESLSDYKKVLELNGDISEKLKHEMNQVIPQLQRQIDERNERLKKEMLGKLKDLGNMCLRPFGLSTDNFSLEGTDNGGYSVKFNPSTK